MTDSPFHDLIGVWVDHVTFGSDSGQMTFVTEEFFDNDEVETRAMVSFKGISTVRWDRRGTKPRIVSSVVAVYGQLERAEHAGDTWTLAGGFGEIIVSARSVVRDKHLRGARPSAPARPVRPPHACEAMLEALADAENGMMYEPPVRQYGYRYTVGDFSIHVINFCPFCGTALPASLNDEWFDRLDGLGIDLLDDDPPVAMQTDEWWRDAGFDDDPPGAAGDSGRRLRHW